MTIPIFIDVSISFINCFQIILYGATNNQNSSLNVLFLEILAIRILLCFKCGLQERSSNDAKSQYRYCFL